MRGMKASRLLDGSKGNCDEDHCSGAGNTRGVRRCKMACLESNVILLPSILQRLPDDLFPCGFIRALFLLSPTAVKGFCDFQNPNWNFFDGEFHDYGSCVVGDKSVVDSIDSKVKDEHLIRQTNVVIDSQTQVDSLKRLFGAPLANSDVEDDGVFDDEGGDMSTSP